MTDPTTLRDRISAALMDLGHPQWDAAEGAAAVLAVLPATTDQTATLSETERRMLGYALNQAQLRMWATGKYTAEEQAALVSLRRMADETQPAEHRPPRHRWAAEFRDPVADEWIPGTRFLNRHHAVERYEAAIQKAPAWKDGTPVERRLVRETTTYSVEAEHQPAAGARQDGAQR